MTQALECTEAFVRQRPSSEALVILTREGGAIPTLMLHPHQSRRHGTAITLGDLHDPPIRITHTSGSGSNGIIDRRMASLHIFPRERPGFPPLDLVVGVKPGRPAVSHDSSHTTTTNRSQTQVTRHGG